MWASGTLCLRSVTHHAGRADSHDAAAAGLFLHWN